MDITSPKHPPEHPDRGIDCEFALEPIYQTALAAAISAGWSEAEAAEAMLSLARNHIADMLPDQGDDIDLEAAARSVV